MQGRNHRIKRNEARVITQITCRYSQLCGIVYALPRKQGEKIVEELISEYDIKAEHYHAGLDPEKRINVQKILAIRKASCNSATIAFGMVSTKQMSSIKRQAELAETRSAQAATCFMILRHSRSEGQS